MACAAVTLLRAIGPTDRSIEIRLLAIAPLVVGPAILAGALGAMRRRWWQSLAALVVVVVQAFWIVPVDHPWASAPAAQGSARLRVFDANVSQDNHHVDRLADQIRRADPEVVTFEELTPPTESRLAGLGVERLFPYRITKAAYGAGGEALWSRTPLRSTTVWSNLNNQFEITATVTFAGRPLTVDVAHVYAPLGFDQPRLWHQQLGALRQRFARQPGRVLVAGDFNATADMPPFRDILADHLRDAAVLAGDGWRMSWPDDQVEPAYLRIDHVLLSRGLTVTRYRLGDYAGSDHKAVIADIAPSG